MKRIVLAATALALAISMTHAVQKQTTAQTNSRRSQQTVTQQPPQQQNARQEPPPPVRPPVLRQGVRRSNKWIKLPSGSSVAVDVSVTGDGVRVYNALTWHLVAVDENDDTKVLWDKSASAFWDKMDIEQIEIEGQDEKAWAVVMRSSRYEQFAEFHDLHTGELIKLVGEEPADGNSVTLAQTASGSGGKRDEPLYELVGSAERWQKIYAEIFAGQDTPADSIKDVDFTQHAIVVYYAGKATNCRGFSVAGAFETEDELLLRVFARTYQSHGNPPAEHPFGIFVVPRMTEKPYVIETDRQGLIGGPEIWKESRRFDPLED